MLLLLYSLSLAAEPPAEAPSELPEASPEEIPFEEIPFEEIPFEEIPFEEIDVYALPDVARARDELVQQLRQEGYRKSRRYDGYTVYRHNLPYHPTVVIHDDGWIQVKRENIRIHAPGHTFASDGAPLEYVKCIFMPTACISVGGLLISPRKYRGMVEEVYDATRPEVTAFNDAVARNATSRRVNYDIPAMLEGVWQDTGLSPEARRLQIFEFWDSRTDTPEGEQIRQAVEAFMVAVIQRSSTPYTSAELASFNARRTAPRPLILPIR
jgi:hypothetical protein